MLYILKYIYFNKQDMHMIKSFKKVATFPRLSLEASMAEGTGAYARTQMCQALSLPSLTATLEVITQLR